MSEGRGAGYGGRRRGAARRLRTAYFSAHTIYKRKQSDEQQIPREQPKFAPAPNEQPHLAATLVIDSWPKGGDPVAHLKVENIGGVGIKDLTAICQTSEMQTFDVDASLFRREVPPSGRLSVGIPPVNGLGKNRILFLDLNYTSKDTTERKFISKYRFILPESNISGSFSIDADQCEELTGEFPGDAPGERILEQLAQPEGTVFLILPEMREGGAPNLIAARSGAKEFVFDPTSKTARFRSGAVQSATQFASAQMHIVSLRWKDMVGLAEIKVDADHERQK